MINASIITIGDELLIGQTIDTNSAFIAQELNRIGIWVQRRIAVGDVWEDIWNALDEEGSKSALVIITGGLGPTADDITKPLLCKYFAGKMVVNQSVLDHVKFLFEKIYRRPGPILERNLKQAEVPDTCTVLHNERGSAPGMWFEKDFSGNDINEIDRGNTIFISLPGVPHEMKGLMTSEVIPRLLQRFTLPAIIHKTVVTSGQGESYIAELIKDFEAALPAHIRLAYLPAFGMVKLRLTSISGNRASLESEMNEYVNQLKLLVADYFVTDEDEPLQVVVGRLLKERSKTVGTAESCTGGFISQLITSISGSSEYYKGTVVCYSDEIKENVIGVDHNTLQKFGAVSEETVKEMVRGTLDRLNVDYALATSGIMGPGGGSEEKPVGLVWMAIGDRNNIAARKFNFRFDRERNIIQTSHVALDYLRKFILTNG